VAVLEGGYDLDAIAGSAAAVVGRMLGHPSVARGVEARPGFESLLDAYRATHAREWPVLRR
jgi:acetoin utilization deacetylase AcuC-like enzyme